MTRFRLRLNEYEVRPVPGGIELYRIGSLGYPLKLAVVTGCESSSPEWTWTPGNRAAMPEEPGDVLAAALAAIKE
ncbi:hypothetical protein [Actinorhabdospora filicis]|nr:hypothetical protein [Actinorhabdospora filicis]